MRTGFPFWYSCLYCWLRVCLLRTRAWAHLRRGQNLKKGGPRSCQETSGPQWRLISEQLPSIPISPRRTRTTFLCCSWPFSSSIKTTQRPKDLMIQRLKKNGTGKQELRSARSFKVSMRNYLSIIRTRLFTNGRLVFSIWKAIRWPPNTMLTVR